MSDDNGNVLTDIVPGSIRRIHLVGVAGTGMGSFAGMLKTAGYEVTGSDENVYPPMSDMLAAWGVRGDDPVRARQPRCSAARPRDHRQRDPPRESGGDGGARARHPADELPSGVRLARARGEAQRRRRRHARQDDDVGAAGARAGGRGHRSDVPRRRRDAELRTRTSGIGGGPFVVVEGDEYDTAYFDKGPKFLHYRAKTAILTSVEFDHADIYRDMAHYESAYEKFAATLPEDGFLAVAASYPNAVRIAQKASRAYVATYAVHGDADYVRREALVRPRGRPLRRCASPAAAPASSCCRCRGITTSRTRSACTPPHARSASRPTTSAPASRRSPA